MKGQRNVGRKNWSWSTIIRCFARRCQGRSRRACRRVRCTRWTRSTSCRHCCRAAGSGSGAAGPAPARQSRFVRPGLAARALSRAAGHRNLGPRRRRHRSARAQRRRGRFLSKSAESELIIEAIGQVMAGETWVSGGMQPICGDADQTELARRVGELTPQQYRILRMLGEGLLNKQIAWELTSPKPPSRRT